MGANLILFGAGASYGSDTEGTPPLGDRLFDALATFDPAGWGGVSKEHARLFSKDFERGMEALAEGRPTDVDRLQRAMAAYFFQFEPRPCSLYVKLAERICRAQWNGALASLNYERLLELAVFAMGLQPIVGRSSSTETEVELCFPHGCCHLFDSIRAATGIAFDRGIQFDGGRVTPVRDPSEFVDRLQHDVIPPVMSYFEPRKRARSGVSFIRAERERYAALVASAAVVAVIGVRVRPLDVHIWGPLASTKARLVYCAGGNAVDDFCEWGRQSNRTGDAVIPGYWAEGFYRLCCDLSIVAASSDSG